MKMKKSTLFLIAVFLTGISLLLYPAVSEYWNSFHQSRAIAAYTRQVSSMNGQSTRQLLEEARAYNRQLWEQEDPLRPEQEAHQRYEGLLNVSGNGIMGYIEIPAIQVFLPVYHGVGETVLQVGAGHIEGTSLPVGGPGTHCALSGHRGLPSARLFTDLDQLEIGDIFTLNVLDQVLTYQVDQIQIVEPEDVSGLALEEGQDLCTLVTCTPYGVNTHRLLVRGRRIENQDQLSEIQVSGEASRLDPVFAAPFLAAPVLLVLLIWMLAATRKKK